MEIGKLPNHILKEIVLNHIHAKRSEIIVRPGIGEDCCAIDFGQDACVLSSDPITGAANEVGRLAVHISCNDVASCGVEPLGLLATVLLPPGTESSEVETIMKQMSEAADSLNVDIIGGHTEITGAVSRCVIISTAIGRVLKSQLVSTAGARPGDQLLMTKFAGLEGTAIIAHDREAELVPVLDCHLLRKAKLLMEKISVVKEGVIAGRFGVSAMHDATEGGLLGAVWELCEASGCGVEIDFASVPILPETLAICSHYGIDPLRLISSGCMLIACEKGEELAQIFQMEGIPSAVIGRMTAVPERVLVKNGGRQSIEAPGSDELYRVLG